MNNNLEDVKKSPHIPCLSTLRLLEGCPATQDVGNSTQASSERGADLIISAIQNIKEVKSGTDLLL